MKNEDNIFSEVKDSLGDLQALLYITQDGKLKKWLEKRIDYLQKHPEKQIGLGVLTMDDIKYKRKRVDGFKMICERINKKIKDTNESFNNIT